MSKERTKRLVLLQAKLISRTRFALWLCNRSIGILNVLKPHECDEHPCTAAAAFALLPVQACVVCRQCPHLFVVLFTLHLTSDAASCWTEAVHAPLRFHRKGNTFGSGRSAEAMCRSDSEHFAASTLRIVKPPSFVFEKNKAILQMREAVPVFVPMTVLSFEGPFNGSHSHVGSRQRASDLLLSHACVDRQQAKCRSYVPQRQ